MILQHITMNMSGVVRRETLAGRDYHVVPMVMITEGVHNGSGGALYYPEAELSKTPASWNHKPIVVYHPTHNGEGISACDPVVINTRMVGLVMNARYTKGSKTRPGKLRAEAWIEIDRASAVDERVLETIEADQMMEVSTGLFTDNEEVSGEFKGKEYTAIARNYRPDHLALLPDQKGACSIADGAGLLQLNAQQAADPLCLHVVSDALKQLAAKQSLKFNELSFGQISSALCSKLREGYTGESPYDVWCEEVYDDYFIYYEGSELYKQSYTVKDDAIVLVGDTERVVRKIVYETAAVENSAPTTNKETTMSKTEKATKLIANGQWVETDRAWLEGLDDAKLDRMLTPAAPVANAAPAQPAAAPVAAPAPAPVANAAPAAPAPAKPLSVDEYIANAPAELRDSMRQSMAWAAQQKAELVERITANANCPFSKEFLAAKDITELQGLAAMAASAAPVANGQPEMFRQPVYFGQAGGPVGNAAGYVEEPLMPVVMNFDK